MKTVNWIGLVRLAAFSMFGAICFGILHDLVTAHIYVEYFTVHHPKLVESTSPIVMALLWGVLATFWVGLPIGIVLHFANELGSSPHLEETRIRALIVRGLVMLLLSSMAVLLIVYLMINLIPMDKRKPDFDEARRAMSVAITHMYSYMGGTAVGVSLALRILYLRSRLKREVAIDEVEK